MNSSTFSTALHISYNLQLLKMNKLPQKQEEKRKVVSDKHLYDFVEPSVELLESVKKYLKAQEPDY